MDMGVDKSKLRQDFFAINFVVCDIADIEIIAVKMKSNNG